MLTSANPAFQPSRDRGQGPGRLLVASVVAVAVAVMLPMELLPTASAPRAGVRGRRG